MTGRRVPERVDLLADSPFVSVAIIVYNGMPTIERCIQSLLATDYPKERFEIIVVDGRSTDGTLESLHKFPVTVIAEDRKCRGIARNTALQHCKGQIVAFIDADCVPSISWLEDHVSLHQDPNVMVVAGSVLQGGDSSVAAKVHHMTEFASQSPHGRRKVGWEVATCNASFKRSVFNKVGFFPEMDRSEDCLLCWKILRVGLQVVIDPLPCVEHVHKSMNFSSLFGESWKQGYSDRPLQDAFGNDPPYKLPRRFLVTAILLPSLVLARFARYLVKVAGSSSDKKEILLFIPILFAASISWAHGYLTATFWWRR